MPTSNYMPDVITEIAFTSGWSTPAASRVWTDVSAYVELQEGFSMGFGRGNERGTTDANTLSVVLDNSDGRFTMGRSGGPYSPNVKIGRPIRVRAVPVTGVSSTRFTGFVDEWAQVFPEGVSTRQLCRVTATSMLARLGAGVELRSGIEEERHADSPVAYYPLSEPAGSLAANDVSGNSQQMLRVAGTGAAVVFGTAIGPGTDDLTAATFAAGQYLVGALTTAPGASFTVEGFFSFSTLPVASSYLLFRANGVRFGLGDTGRPNVDWSAVAGDDMSAVTDLVAGTHHVAATFAPNDRRLYVNGVEVRTDTVGNAPTANTGVYVGGGDPGFDGGIRSPLNGVVAHVAVYNSALSATRIAALAKGITAAAETGGAIITRVADYAGLAATEIAADAGSTAQVYALTQGRTALDVMRSVEATQNGVLFDSRGGVLTFSDRSDRYNAVSAFTLDASLQQVEADVAPTGDRSTLINECTVTLRDGTVSATHIDQASVDAYGPSKLSIEIDSSDETAPIGLASWLVGIYAEPTTRIPQLSIDLLPLSAATQALIFAADIGTRFGVSNWPTTMVSTTGDYFVEGWTETIGRESYTFTYNVSDATPFVNVWTIGDAVKGVLDAGFRIAY